MVPDVVEYDELRTGERREGSYYAFASFFQKLATGLAIWAMGQALAFSGYITPVIGELLPTQPPQAGQAIRLFAGPIPAGLLVLAIAGAALWTFTSSDEKKTVVHLHSTQLISGGLFIVMGILMLEAQLAYFNNFIPPELA